MSEHFKSILQNECKI